MQYTGWSVVRAMVWRSLIWLVEFTGCVCGSSGWRGKGGGRRGGSLKPPQTKKLPSFDVDNTVTGIEAPWWKVWRSCIPLSPTSHNLTVVSDAEENTFLELSANSTAEMLGLWPTTRNIWNISELSKDKREKEERRKKRNEKKKKQEKEN